MYVSSVEKFATSVRVYAYIYHGQNLGGGKKVKNRGEMRSELPRFTQTHHIHDISLETCPYTPYSQSGMISVIMEAVQAVFQAQIRGKSKTDQPIKRFFRSYIN